VPDSLFALVGRCHRAPEVTQRRSSVGSRSGGRTTCSAGWFPCHTLHARSYVRGGLLLVAQHLPRLYMAGAVGVGRRYWLFPVWGLRPRPFDRSMQALARGSNCNTGWVSSSEGVPGVGASFGTVAAGLACVATIFGVGWYSGTFEMV